MPLALSPACRRLFFVRVPTFNPFTFIQLTWPREFTTVHQSPVNTESESLRTLPVWCTLFTRWKASLEDCVTIRQTQRGRYCTATRQSRAADSTRTSFEAPHYISAPFATPLHEPTPPPYLTTHHAQRTCARDCRNYKSVLTQWQLRYTLFSMNLWSSPFLGVPLVPPPWRSRASAVHDGNHSSADGNFLSIVTSIRNKKEYEVNITVRIRKFVRPLLPYHERINENLPFHWQHLTRHPCDSEKHGTTPHHPYYLRLKTFACRLSQ